MRRILFVLGTGYLPGTISGANVSVHALCKRLAAAGDQPMVVCMPDAAAPTGEGPRPAYPVVRLAQPFEAMLEMIQRLEPDAVVVRGALAAGEALQRTAARPRRLHIYFSDVFYGFSAPPAAEAPHLRYAVTSRYLATFARAYLGFEAALIPPLVEPAEYRCSADGDAILLVDPSGARGQHLAAAIAARLPHRRFLAVRSGPADRQISPALTRLANVEWVAATADMRAAYARARLVLMPSILEQGWGRTVSEAQVSGIPAVASDRGALPDTVGPGGLTLSLFEPVARWCEAIESLFADEARYAELSRAALRHAGRAELAADGVMARFDAFLKS